MNCEPNKVKIYICDSDLRLTHILFLYNFHRQGGSDPRDLVEPGQLQRVGGGVRARARKSHAIQRQV